MKYILKGWILLLAALPPQAYALTSPSYTIGLNTMANGGGNVSSANYRLSHLTGQPLVVGPVSSAGYTVQGGFYSIRLLEELLAKRNTCLVYDSAAIYAGFDGAGIWKSNDHGTTWNAVVTPPDNPRIRGLVIHPTTRATLYAATYGGGVYQSTDSGDTWSPCSGQPGNLNSVTLAIDPAGTIYAGTEGGIFTSGDCNSWSAVNTGLTVDAAKPPVAIAIDPVMPANLYAGLDGAGVYKSTDGGANWTAATTQPTNLRVKALAIRNSSQQFAATYGGGVFVSSDSGDSWSACANTNLTNRNVVSLTIDADGKLYAGSEAGVFVSTDSCATWTAINTGLP